MPSLDDLRKRIASVKSTQKITKAMKMVAAAKLRKAQEMAEKGRPYSDKMDLIIQNLSKAINDPSNAPKLLVGTGEDKIHLCVVMTADRGLCGGFNTNICKLAKKYFDEAIKSSKNLKIITVGTKGLDQLKRDYGKYIIKKINLKDKKKLTFLDAEEICKQIVELFKNKDIPDERFLNESTIKKFTSRQYVFNENRRGAGFDKPCLEDQEVGVASKNVSMKSFGHTGFTGTLAWADPEKNIVLIFLSNRIHPKADNKKLIEMNVRTELMRLTFDMFNNE